jgi:hypothetical protein
MTYIDIFAAATDAAIVLRGQVAVALHKQALVVLAEDAGTTNHAQRVALAQRVLKDPPTWAGMAIWRVLENGTIAGAPTAAGDGLVQSVVANSWDTLSKVTV